MHVSGFTEANFAGHYSSIIANHTLIGHHIEEIVMNMNINKAIGVGLAALTLAGTLAATSAPALAGHPGYQPETAVSRNKPKKGL